jgi:transposase-like protein
MNTTTQIPETLLEAVRYFSDLDVCHQYMVQIKWPDGKITCPKCGGDKIGIIASRRMFQCKGKECRKQFSAKVNTIFEDSPIGLDKWFVAVWVIAGAKNGISSYEVHRALGVTQKTAWFMLHRVRLAMRTESFRKIRGEIESDESFIGGKSWNMHAKVRKKEIRGRGAVGKVVVHGLLERGGEVRVGVVPNQKKGTLQARVRENVEPGSSVFTDTLLSYVGLDKHYIHEMVNHAEEYVRGRVHTNGLENFWSLLKRCLKGTYVAVSPWHLFRYLDEETFRFNKREGNDGDRFKQVMQSVLGKRLQYAELTGKRAMSV